MQLTQKFNIRKVLVAPLDWGLGHATRCIPLIKALQQAGMEVVLAASGPQASLLTTEFPELTCLPLEGYRIRYSKHSNWFAARLLQQVPRLLQVIRKEQQWLQQIVKDHQIDLVLSDNRYGLHHATIPSIFITHQLQIQAPWSWLENLIQKIHYHYLKPFKACWVPDVATTPNAAGTLSHPQKLPLPPVQYIGLLSRFQYKETEGKYHFCFLLSGPEPQRTMLEQQLMKEIDLLHGNIVLVRGKPGSNEPFNAPAHVTVFNHLPSEALEEVLLQSVCVVCRSGYTSLMELYSLRRKMLLIPTPGQTEQEYLAAKYARDGFCMSVPQDELEVTWHLPRLQAFEFIQPNFTFFTAEQLPGLLLKALEG